MSRDFKEEYTEYMNGQTPDLWADIESRLPARRKKRRIPKRYVSFGITAAAALLIGVCAVPFYFGIGSRDSYDGGMAQSGESQRVYEAKDTVDGEGAAGNTADSSADGAAGNTADSETNGGTNGGTNGSSNSGANCAGNFTDGGNDMADDAEPMEQEDATRDDEADMLSEAESDTDGEEEKKKDAETAVQDLLKETCSAEKADECLLLVTILAAETEEESGQIYYQAQAEGFEEPIQLVLSQEQGKQIEIKLQVGHAYRISACREEDGYLILSVEAQRQ